MTFSPFNPTLKSRDTAQCLYEKLAIRLVSVLDASVEFWPQFYTNNCAHLSALRAHCDTRWLRAHRKHGASKTEDPSGLNTLYLTLL